MEPNKKNYNLKCTQIVLVAFAHFLRMMLRGSAFLFLALVVTVVFFKRFLLDLLVILSIGSVLIKYLLICLP